MTLVDGGGKKLAEDCEVEHGDDEHEHGVADRSKKRVKIFMKRLASASASALASAASLSSLSSSSSSSSSSS